MTQTTENYFEIQFKPINFHKESGFKSPTSKENKHNEEQLELSEMKEIKPNNLSLSLKKVQERRSKTPGRNRKPSPLQQSISIEELELEIPDECDLEIMEILSYPENENDENNDFTPFNNLTNDNYNDFDYSYERDYQRNHSHFETFFENEQYGRSYCPVLLEDEN